MRIRDTTISNANWKFLEVGMAKNDGKNWKRGMVKISGRNWKKR